MIELWLDLGIGEAQPNCEIVSSLAIMQQDYSQFTLPQSGQAVEAIRQTIHERIDAALDNFIMGLSSTVHQGVDL